MTPIVSIAISIIFLAVEGVWLFTILWEQGGRKVGNPKAFTAVQEVSAFVAAVLFFVMLIAMTLRAMTYVHEPASRISIHVALAVGVSFLIVLKILISRFFKKLSGSLLALGIAIYTMSFILIMTMVGFWAIARLAEIQEKPAETGAKVAINDTKVAESKLDDSILKDHCLWCHDDKVIFAKKRTREAWIEVVKKMNGKDPDLVPLDKLGEIVDYLVGSQEGEGK